jgi:cell division protein FtsB
MAKKQDGQAPAPRKRLRRKKARVWLWVLLSVLLVLLLIGAGVMGLNSDSSYRAALQALRAENKQQDQMLRSLSAENAAKDAQVRSLSAGNADKDARIQSLSADNADKDARIAGLSADNADKAAQILDLQAQLAAAVLPEPVGPPETADPAAPEGAELPQPDAWGYVDEDGDGLILVPIRGKFTGYMLIVLDPSRVVLSCEPKMMGSHGYDVQHFVEKEDGVAGINGGSFADPGGHGDGSLPDTMIFSHGEPYCGGQGMGYYFTGIDDQYVLHVGVPTAEKAQELHIQEGCCFRPGPILVQDGQLAPENKLSSGLNPRTAIGQRSDGAILMLVVEGRQPSRIGCSFREEAELMLRFGAVNASNMDGGSSTMMWYEGEYINNRANVINVRYIPTSWVVLKEGRAGND